LGREEQFIWAGANLQSIQFAITAIEPTPTILSSGWWWVFRARELARATHPRGRSRHSVGKNVSANDRRYGDIGASGDSVLAHVPFYRHLLSCR